MSININSERLAWEPQQKILQAIVFITLIITVITSFSEYFGTTGDIITFLSFFVLLCSFIYIHNTIQLPVLPSILISIIYVMFILGLIRYFTDTLNFPRSSVGPVSLMTSFLHLGEIFGYIMASFTVIFLVPVVFHRDHFFKFLSLLSAFCVLIGLPAYIIGDFSLSFLYVNTYTTIEPFRQFGIDIPALSSVWNDANAMSKVTMAGILGSHYCYLKNKSAIHLRLLLINSFGLFLANSKMAIISLMISYSVYFTYIWFGANRMRLYLICCGILGSFAFLLIMFTDVLNVLTAVVGFQDRVHLWRESFNIFLQYPFFGTGIYDVGGIIADQTTAGSHAPRNSYLRILVGAGIVGGLSYILLIVSTTFNYISKIDSRPDLIVFVLFIAFVLLQFTDTADIFGINKNSLIFGMTMGYLFDSIYIDKKRL